MAMKEKSLRSGRAAARLSIQVQTEFRSCHEILLAYKGHSLDSMMVNKSDKMREMFHIDPDGQGIGASPIYVMCDFTNGISLMIFIHVTLLLVFVE